MSNITSPGIYDIGHADYHADPCPEPSLSRSVLKELVNRSAIHAWASHPRLNPNHEQDFNRQANLGSIAHALLLNEASIIRVLEFENYRTKAAQDLRKEALAADQIPCLPKELEAAQAMIGLARRQLRSTDAADAFTNGKPEQTIVWQEGDLWCRARLDWLPDQDEGDVIIDDYKTTAGAALAEDWAKATLVDKGYDLQAVFYTRAVKAVWPKIRSIRMRFIVQEQKFPHAISVVQITPETLRRAERRMEEGIAHWGRCLRRDRWPGYSRETQFVDAPVWHLQRWENQEFRRDAAKQLGQDIKEQMIEWQAPHGEAA